MFVMSLVPYRGRAFLYKKEVFMEYRLCFDTIPEQFDKYRVRYSPELFRYFIEKAGIGKGTRVLELGPGTGQATEPILDTGCDYTAIELGENFSELLRSKYGSRENFRLINDDFITHDFGEEKFDVIYSAATIQWIPEKVAFGKTFELLRKGGTLGMIMLSGEYVTPQPELYGEIQKVYDKYFKPETAYPHAGFVYENALNYGFREFETRYFKGEREYTADEYVQYLGTHSDHITLKEPYRTPFFEGIREAVKAHGDRIVYNDTYIINTVCKP